MPWPVHPTGFFGARGDNDTYRIERSLRFNSADSAFLSRTPASAGNRKTWTWSGWVKRTALSPATVGVFEAASNASNRSVLFFTSTDTLSFFENSSGSTVTNIATNQVFRDFSSWSHIIISVDTTQSVSSERVKLYHNGTQITSFASSTYPSQNFDTQVNSTVASVIGAGTAYTPSAFINGYLTEINFIDGQALTPSSFGETDAITGRWKAKAYSGTYGTNGFYLKFADNSGTTATTLGKDSSPNGNNWTPNNFSVTAGAGNDSLVDSPTNYGTDTGVGGEGRGNYATWNPLRPSGYVFSNGNLDVVGSGANNQNYPLSNFTAPSGKWYFECTSASMGTDPFVGISDIAKKYSIIYGKAGTISKGDVITYTTLSTKSSFTGGDIIGIAVNADNSTVAFYKNNVLQDTINFSSALMVNTDWYAICYSSSNPTTTWTINFGQRPFAYTAPAGFRSLCTTNLPQPTIQKPSRYMDVVTYTGTGTTQTISGLGFSPDLLWTKGRSLAQSHNIFDTQRSGQRLRSDTTGSEASTTVTLGSNGFTLGTETESNNSGSTFVAWAWDEAPIAGMDIVSFTAPSGTSQSTVAHNLGVAPKMIIAKNRDTNANNWAVFHSSVCDTTSKFLQLNTTAAIQTFNTVWGASLPTSSVFGVTGGGVAASGVNCIAYLFAEVEGFSRFGSYTGNGSADGPFVWCGFRPRWILIKSTVEGSNWLQWDTARMTFNAMPTYIMPSSSSAETTDTTYSIDSISNGFKIRGTGQFTGFNNNGNAYIFAAFAESPFKYARAR